MDPFKLVAAQSIPDVLNALLSFHQNIKDFELKNKRLDVEIYNIQKQKDVKLAKIDAKKDIRFAELENQRIAMSLDHQKWMSQQQALSFSRLQMHQLLNDIILKMSLPDADFEKLQVSFQFILGNINQQNHESHQSQMQIANQSTVLVNQ